MTDVINITQKGFGDLSKRLERLERSEFKTAVRKATREAVKPLIQTARRLAPVQTGALKDSIRIVNARASQSRGTWSVTVGTKGNKTLFEKYSKVALSKVNHGGWQGAYYTRVRTRGKYAGRRTIGALRHAHLVIGGTNPHDIFLGWRSIGSLRLKTYREHPGSRPEPIFDDAIEAEERTVSDRFYEALEKYV